MIYLLIIVLPSLIWICIVKLRYSEESVGSFILHLSILFIMMIVWMLVLSGIQYMSIRDSEILNGYVVSKSRNIVPCSHTYICGETCSGSGKNRTCSPKICNEHPFDIDWDVSTTVGNFSISRIDSQGLIQPKRWRIIRPYDFASSIQHNKNYTLIDKDQYNTSKDIYDRYKKQLYEYPSIYDYYKINRVINDTKFNFDWINEYLNKELMYSGKQKQLNIIIVITNKPYEYYTAIRQYWHGTKRNDVQLFYGIDDDLNIKWFKGMTFANGQFNNVMLENLRFPTLNQKLTKETIDTQVKIVKNQYVRLSNSKISYMLTQYQPSYFTIIILTILNFAITVIIAPVIISNELLNTILNHFNN